MHRCRICNTITFYGFNHKVLKKYDVAYFQCPECGLLQTESPFWLEEAYFLNSDIGYDIGYVSRNIYYSNMVSRVIYHLFDKASSFVDYGGGYGLFTRLMRDIGFDFFWIDEYAQNIFAKGFELNENQNIMGITAFEVFEHLPDIQTLMNFFNKKVCGFLLFSTKLYGNAVPEPEEWSYYSFEGGQHISLFNNKTFSYIASKYSLFYYSNGGQFHLFSRKKIPYFKWILLNSKYTKSFFSLKMASKLLDDSNYLKNLQHV